MYCIYNKTFSSKMKCKNYTRELLKRNLNKTITEGEDFNYLISMIDLHPEKQYKIGDGIESFHIKHDFYNNIALFINQKTKKLVSVSWVSICNFKAPSITQLFKDAMRQAIDPQIYEFRQKKFREGKLICEFCNRTDNIHIDHIKQFKQIYEEFFEEYEFEIPKYYTKEEGTNRCKFTDHDTELKNVWYNFHKEHASLRPLCKDCNLSRPKYFKVKV